MIVAAWKKFEMNGNDVLETDVEFSVKDLDPQKKVNYNKGQNFRRKIGSHFLKNLKSALKKTCVEADFEEMETASNNASHTMLMEDSISENSDIEEKAKAVTNFLSRFKMSSDVGSETEINLHNVIRVLPKQINNINLNKIDLIRFSMIQKSIISFQNDDKDELFKFYNDRSLKRIESLRVTSEFNRGEVDNVCGRIYSLAFKQKRINKGMDSPVGHKDSESYIGGDQPSESDI